MGPRDSLNVLEKKKKYLAPTENRTPDRLAHGLVAITTTLPRLHEVVITISILCLPACKSSPVTGLEWSRGFQEVMVPRFHDNGTGRW